MKTITKSMFVLTIAFCFVIGAGQDEAFGQRKRGKRGGKSVSQKSVKRNSRPRTKQTPQLGNKKNKSLQGKIRPYKSNQPGLRQAQRKGINGGSQFVQPPSLNNLSGGRNLNRMGDMQMSKQGLSGAATNSNQRRTKMEQSVTLTGSTVSGNLAANDLYKVRQNPKGNRQSANLFTRPSDLPQSNGFEIYDGPIRNQQQHDVSRQESDIYDSPLNSKTALQSVFTNNENVGPKAILNQTRPQNAANPTTGVTISGGDLTGNMNTISGHASTRNMMDKSSTTLAVGEQAGSNGLFTRPSAWPQKNASQRGAMEPFVNLSFDGPQFDDFLATHRGFHDVNESRSSNDAAGIANGSNQTGFDIYDTPLNNQRPGWAQGVEALSNGSGEPSTAQPNRNFFDVFFNWKR